MFGRLNDIETYDDDEEFKEAWESREWEWDMNWSGIAAGVAGVLVLAFLISCCCRRRRRGQVLTPPPAVVAVNTSTSQPAPYPQQQYVPHPVVAPYPVPIVQSANVSYPAPYPPGPPYPAAPGPLAPYPTGAPSHPTAPEVHALPPTYEQATGTVYEKHPPYNPSAPSH